MQRNETSSILRINFSFSYQFLKKVLWTVQIDAIQLDPAWNHGHPTGRVTHTGQQDFDVFLAELKKHAAGDGGLASDQIRQRQAIISLDIPGEFGVTLPEVAKKVRAKLLVMSRRKIIS